MAGGLEGGGERRRARWLLLAQHSLQSWAWRAWEFLVVVALVEARPASLLPTALFSFTVFAAVLFLGPALGDFVDSAGGLQAVVASMGLHHASVIAAGLVLSFWFAGPGRASAPQTEDAHLLFWPMVAAVCGLGGASSIGYAGAKIVVQREWSVRLCGRDSDLLASVTSNLQTIDLICSLLSPIVAGLVSQYASVFAAVLLISVMNVVCWLAELGLARGICNIAPELAREGKGPEGNNGVAVDGEAGGDSDGRGGGGSIGAILAGRWRLMRESYFSEPASRAGIPLSLLYMSCMTLGMLMTAYMKSIGMSEVALSVMRAGGAISGVSATIIHPIVHKRVRSLPRLGMFGVWQLQVCILIGALATMPFFPMPTPLRIPVLCVAIVLSRYGLWSFDVATVQIFQERVPLHKMGRFNGVQESLNSASEITMALLAMVLHSPSQFWILALISLSSITSAALLFTHAFPKLEQAGREAGAYRPLAEDEPPDQGDGASPA